MTSKDLDFSPLENYVERSAPEMLARARAFRDELRLRRTVRHFSDRPVAREVIEHCIEAAASAPSGANRQPWHFAVVTNPSLKRRIRTAAEEEEQTFYRERAPQDWLDAIAPLGTDENKPFLEIAPYLIVIFAQLHGIDAGGAKFKHYYVNESVGIATGMLISALHHAGLATLTHTPAPMRFLNEILDRPTHERPYLILVTGHPAADAVVPRIERKKLAEVARFID
jgi:nitroreductase